MRMLIVVSFILFELICYGSMSEEGIGLMHWHKVINRKTVSSHRISWNAFSHIIKNEQHFTSILDWTIKNPRDSIFSFVICYLAKSNEQSKARFGVHNIAYVNKKLDLICELSNSTLQTGSRMSEINLGPIPAILKIDESLIMYFTDEMSFLGKFISSNNIDEIFFDSKSFNSIKLQIMVDLNPLKSAEQSSSNILLGLLDGMKAVDNHCAINNNNHEKLLNKHLYPWHTIVSKYNAKMLSWLLQHLRYSELYDQNYTSSQSCNDTKLFGCNWDELNTNEVFDSSFNILNIGSMSKSCLVAIISYLAGSDDVVHVSISGSSEFMNYEARGRLQTGMVEVEPYHLAGLRGNGQIVGVADSGISDISCFFVDSSGNYSTVTTSRTGLLEPNRRKVIQYVPFADDIDDEGGHGTHVCASLLGESLGDFGKMNGIASDAKLAFFDIGVASTSELKLPSLHEVLKTSYHAGARVHSNSWGNMGGIYGQMSQDADRFTYERDNVLVLFAVGNAGIYGMRSINAPANAKNVLSVGAGQLRTVYTDKPLSSGDYAVAMFSSIGPTSDGRYKPDVIAPGDFIVSAYAASPKMQRDFFQQSWNGSNFCAVHQMRGTSMATPLVAGIALLIRQFFMEQKFWASLCDSRYAQCRKGPFEPSGYLLKTLILHSGSAVPRYSDPAYDQMYSYFQSLSLAQPPDYFQGYGEVLLRNILPLPGGQGLAEKVHLLVWDAIEIREYSSMELAVDISSAPSDQIKITIAWYDPPHAIGYASRLLIHDLDLIVRSPSGYILLGNKGNQTFLPRDIEEENVILDDKNPNEQVHILHPKCKTSKTLHHDCKYIVTILSHALPYGGRQKFALVITTSGFVSEPAVIERDSSESAYKAFSSSGDDAQCILSSVDTRLLGELVGGQQISSRIDVSAKAMLNAVTVVMHFSHNGSIGVWPSNLLLSIEDPHRHSVIVGELDASIRANLFMADWPEHWMSSANGTFIARIGLKGSSLHGRGVWTIAIRNGMPNSPAIQFNSSISLEFDCHQDDDGSDEEAPVAAVASAEERSLSAVESDEGEGDSAAFNFSSPTNSLGDYSHHSHSSAGIADSKEAGQQESSFVDLPFSSLRLRTDEASLRIISIGEFRRWGFLDRIAVSISPSSGNVTLRGIDAWLLEVIVTAPNGLTAQVGGFKRATEKDRFYWRTWPELWMTRVAAKEHEDWAAERDLHAAELLSNYSVDAFNLRGPVSPSLSNSTAESLWRVELTLGYASYSNLLVSYSGSVRLYFRRDLSDPEELSSSTDTPSMTERDPTEEPNSAGLALAPALRYLFASALVVATLFLLWKSKAFAFALLTRSESFAYERVLVTDPDLANASPRTQLTQETNRTSQYGSL